MSGEPFYLLHTQPDPQRLAAWAARRGLLDEQGDLGYALHALLHAAFGPNAPQPFRYLDAKQGLLAYTRLSAVELARCCALAEPDVTAALGLGQTLHYAGPSTRPFPMLWESGHTLGFEVRVRPIIREVKTGRERDVFLASIEKAGSDALDRKEVYVQWLREQFERQGGAELIAANVIQYQRLGVTRKTQKGNPGARRQSRVVNGPDVVLTGQLRVNEPQAFAKLLARGVGRHRTFGFGLLLLRSACA